MKQLSPYTSLFFLILGLILVNFLASQYFNRFDLTQDNRYTLSPAALNIAKEVKEPLVIDVFLEGSFPSEFRRLRNETRQLLEEFEAYNSNIHFNFINPVKEDEDANAIAQNFYKKGMTPARINIRENGKNSESIIFPWALAHYANKSVSIGLLKNKLGASDEERVNSSVQQLEYAFANGISQLIYPRKKKIAIMRGNGELPNANIADFVSSLRDYYFTAPFTLDSAATQAQKTLEELQKFDLLIDPKPTQAYTEKEKYVLDQFIMNGGKSIFLTERVAMEKDSLMRASGKAFALPRNLNLGDFFFSYGIRINPVLVQDLYSAPIILASGKGENTRFNPYPWFYSPLSEAENSHPITHNIEAVKFDFANTIDTLKNSTAKTILLSTSPKTKIENVPREINLDLVTKKPDFASYNEGKKPLAVLVQGKFTSVYKNRVKPFKLQPSLNQSKPTKMLVVADGDVVKNEVQRKRPLELGFERYTGNIYGNKEFLMNAVNYMLDDRGLVAIRSKEISIPFLNKQKTANERRFWQALNMLAPLLALAFFGFIYNLLRKRRYILK